MHVEFRIAMIFRLMLVVVSVASVAAYANSTPAEHAVKAAIAVKITKFVTWPAAELARNGGYIRFCVLANSHILDAFNELQNVPIQGRLLKLNVLDDPEATAGNCDVLYLEKGSIRRTDIWLEHVADKPILTIGEAGILGEDQSIVKLSLRRKKVRFAINLEASEQSGLTVGAQLLHLAAVTSRRGDDT